MLSYSTGRFPEAVAGLKILVERKPVVRQNATTLLRAFLRVVCQLIDA